MRKFNGEKLKQLRIEKGLNQTELALCAGVSQVSLSKWESLPTAVPRRSNIEKVAKELGVTIDYFYVETDRRKEENDFIYSDEEILQQVINLVIKGQTNIRLKETKNNVLKEISDILCKYQVEEILMPKREDK